MRKTRGISRRQFIGSMSLATACAGLARLTRPADAAIPSGHLPLEQFGYGDVTLNSQLHERQLRNIHAVLMEHSEDSLLKPFRQMAGQPAPGADLGGWYHYDPNYDPDTVTTGFAPGATFGQWVSALARYYAITGDPATREKVLRLNRLYAETMSPDFYEKNRFPAYCYDKLVCGLIDSHQFAHDAGAFSILERTTDTALPHLPGKAVEHGQRWRKNPSVGYTWDESYTISENLFIAYQRGGGDRYRSLAIQYLDDDNYYDPLAEDSNVLAGRHAYSYVNSLSSAMQAYLTLGSKKHLRAARNAFEMLKAQSFATGAWGPDEQLRAPDSNDLYASLTNTHSSFETPCGSYAHFKLTRYLLRVTRDSRYGNSMERVMYNTVLGAKPLLTDGSTFYYSDYNFHGHKFYKHDHWPCCSGTLPQVAADYRINSYFHDRDSVYVNLYIPSTLRWTVNGAQILLTQSGEYPFEGRITIDVALSRSTEFAVHLRIPEWAAGSPIYLNGKAIDAATTPGKFAEIRREWKRGDRIEVDLPQGARLEPIDTRHPQTVALLVGPLVLFAITDGKPTVTARQLLAAAKDGAKSWRVETASGPMRMLPFTEIKDESYSTYLTVT
ncbi:MAG TPA: beta-L-arabinofuranosidase domain-containing protein [Candidatus Acidoferrum sp.]|nr:beta-L-arabinofuranosidase domain-containing protein [Candidatus Acidoferrum sp.]